MKKWLFICLVIATALMMVVLNGFFRLESIAGEKAAPAYYLLAGKVIEVDLKNNKIVVTTQANKSFQLVINDKTVMTKAGKVIALSGIKKMDPVKVNYRINQGERIADSIAIFRQPKATIKASSAKIIK